MRRLTEIVDISKLRKSHQVLTMSIDIVMVILIILNLGLILFDLFFSSKWFQQGLSWLSPQFTEFYRNTIHADFISYDMIFVSIFIIELLGRWALAIYQKTYHRWFFYPFVHWYDVLGCIPVGSFRWLRLLRVISILYRLQKYQVIDLSNTYPVKFIKKYVNVLVEEISDRVVTNVLDGVQDQVRSGNPVVAKVVKQVLLPQKSTISDWLNEKINDITDTVYQPRKEVIRRYIDQVIAESMSQDPKVTALEKMPMVGDAITSVIETTVSDLVFNVIDQLINDIGHEDTDVLVKELTDIVIDRILEPSQVMSDAGRDVIIEVLEVVKAEVQIQQWKLAEQPA